VERRGHSRPALHRRAIRSGLFWDVQNYLGLACDRLQRQGRFREAEQHLDKLAELRDVYGFAFAGTNHDGESAMFHLERRDLAAARESVERYIAGRQEYALRVLGLGIKAKILTHAGDTEAAVEALGAAKEILDSSDVVPPWHASSYALARLHHDVEAVAASGESAGRAVLARARKSRRDALRATRSVASQRTETLRLAGTLAWLAARRREARRQWMESIRFGEQIGARPELARTWLEVSRRLAPEEKLAGIAASEYRRRARATFEELGLDWDLARVDAETPAPQSV
jgi:tetratricopeptide (TPR) repeat protein